MSQVQGGLIRPDQSSQPSTEADVPPLLNLPLELVFMISEKFLDPASALALSLTCKDLKAAIFAKSRRRSKHNDWRVFLPLLEKDVSRCRPTYYCDDCVCLHYYDPAQDNPAMHSHLHIFRYGDCRRNSLYLPGTNFVFGYHHARLLMNQYLYGAPHDWFNNKFGSSKHHGQHSPRWTQKWASKVIAGELFLSATHTVSFIGDGNDFRHILDYNDYNICRHVGTRKSFENSYHRGEGSDGLLMYWQRFGDIGNTILVSDRSAFSPPWAPIRVIDSFRIEDRFFVPPAHRAMRVCTDVPGSCGFCATDYATTLEKRVIGGGRPVRQEWTLTITAYHYLGDCRSPYDRKWAAFRGFGWSCFSPRDRVKVFRSFPGDVRERWESAVRRENGEARLLDLLIPM
ncbi:hypothetical protein M434DRAFT_14694 [Hypoxylon sp. CO27-5]|nr:hypothetical protein M434DRAFT_14694 [Hypoxylon sp. CO27-5]